MRKFFFNQYKLKRQWKRRLSHGVTPALIVGRSEKSARDFAWHTTKMNPFYRGEVGRKTTIYITIIILSLVAMAAIGIFHPFFHIHAITISGIQRINQNEFLGTVKGIVEGRRAYLFPRKSYFLLDAREIEHVLHSRYPVSRVIVKKAFPSSLSIAAEEKISTIIHDNGKTYSMIGLDGHVLETIRAVGESEWKKTTSTDPGVHIPDIASLYRDAGAYPVLYQEKNDSEAPLNVPVVPAQVVQHVIAWYQALQNQLGVSIRFFEQEDSIGNTKIHTSDGWYIHCRIDAPHEEQLAALEAILKERKNRRALQYIDVRFPGKVFWQ